MTNDLPATSSAAPETPAEEALPVRQRATAAETRLTPAEWGLLSILKLMQFSVTIDFIITAPLGPQLMRVFGILQGWLEAGGLVESSGGRNSGSSRQTRPIWARSDW